VDKSNLLIRDKHLTLSFWVIFERTIYTRKIPLISKFLDWLKGSLEKRIE